MDIINAFGQTVTDYNPELAEKLEQVGYGTVDGEDKRELANWMVKRFCKQKLFSDLHPAIAALECALADGEVRYKPIRRWALLFLAWLLRKGARKSGDRPGINDGLMVRWYWTHDQKYVDQMLERAQREDEVGWSCRWMLKSVSESHPLLGTQMSRSRNPPWPGF